MRYSNLRGFTGKLREVLGPVPQMLRLIRGILGEAHCGYFVRSRIWRIIPSMTQRSNNFAYIFLALFGVPFALAGLFFAALAFRTTTGESKPGVWIALLFGAVFVMIGGGLIAAAGQGYKESRRQVKIRSEHPTEPWLWREDWAVGRTDGTNPSSTTGIWVFAIFWDLISFSIAIAMLPQLSGALDPRLIFILGFPLIGVIVTGIAIRGTLRIRRYGRTSFWFSKLPISLGGGLTGDIHLRLPVAVDHGVDLSLACIRRITTGSGKNRSTSDNILWQAERNVSAAAVMRTDTESRIPVDFELPSHGFETNSDNPNDRILWLLRAEADVPGVDYKDSYEIPVFRTAASSGKDGEAEARESEAEVVAQPVRTNIAITQTGEGIEVYLPPCRNIKQVVFLFAFTVVWTGIVYFLFQQHAPAFFRFVFGGMNVLILVILINLAFGSGTIHATQGGVRIRKALFGFGAIREIPAGQIVAIQPVSNGRADSSGEAMFGIQVTGNAGSSVRIGSGTLTRTEARWIVASLDQALGRLVDTTVQFEGVGIGPPPQRNRIT